MQTGGGMARRDEVLAALSTDAPRSRAEIAEDLGISADHVSVELNNAQKVGQCKRTPEGWLRCGTEAPKGGNGHDIPTFAKAAKLEAPCGGKTSVASSAVDYRAVLADLVARREKLDAAITAVRWIVEAV